MEVSVATTLSEAMTLIKSKHPDSIVLDLMLPDGDGTTLLQHIRATRPEVRVIIATGVLDPHWLQRVRDAQPTGVLTKPIKIQELLRFL
jgi:DNA-binding response OmpR family regulator